MTSQDHEFIFFSVFPDEIDYEEGLTNVGRMLRVPPIDVENAVHDSYVDDRPHYDVSIQVLSSMIERMLISSLPKPI